MQKQTSDSSLLDKLSLDSIMKLKSIEDANIYAEVIDSIENIPFLFNLTKNNRRKLSSYKRWDHPYNYDEREETPNGRIEVDITDPHELVDMDYFRERALYFQKHGTYCDITPNRYPGSRYMRFWREEQRRCRDGYVRESDGEWITGYHYWYLNYSPIQITEDIKTNTKKKRSVTKMRKAERKRDFPKIWDSDYLWFHYIEKAEQNGNHVVNLKSRGRGYSFKGGSSLTRNYYHYKGSNSVAIASSGDYLLGDGILNKSWDILNFIDNNTPWRKSRDYEDRKDHKKASYKDPKTKTEKGILSEIIGVTTGGDPERARGKRAKLVLFEESGKFPHFKTTIGIARPSVEQGNSVFGLIVAWGTGGCVCAGTKVWTANGGLKNVEDLKASDGIIGFDGKAHSIEGISEMESSIKECVEITTNTRRVLRCSEDHPILKGIQPNKKAGNIVSNDYVEASKLQVGDRIATLKDLNLFGDKKMWEPRVVGWLIGNGTYGESVKLSNCKSEINNYMDSKFKGSISESYTTKTGKKYRTKSVVGIVPKLKELGIYKQTKLNKTLPLDVHSYCKEDICELLGGFFDADGYVAIRTNKKRNTPIGEISISSMSENLLNEVRLLLQKLGIHGRMRKRLPRLKKKGIQDKNPWYEFTISSRDSMLNFAENIKLFPKVKQERLNKIKEVYKDRKSHMNHEGIVYESIVSIKDIGSQTIYNMHADNTHTYIANGIITHNTAGSDFDGIKEAFYSPETFNMMGIPNVFDKKVAVGSKCGYYCGEYMNREGCYDRNGNSDVITALIEIFSGRDIIKKSSKDPNALHQEKADRSITPQEACMRKEGSLFNVEDLSIHLADVTVNPKMYTDASWKVKLTMNEGKIKWSLSDRLPVRQYPVVENKGLEGCVEIFEHPIERDGSVQSNIYVAGVDPYDDDTAGGASLGSILIGNRLTRRIVAEYTGRPQTAEEFYEICYRLLKFYNAKANYENNKKGMFQYFDRIQSTYLLCDTPGILRDMEITKKVGFGNTSKGTNATKAVNNWGNSLIRSYLMEPAYGKEEGERNYRTIVSPGMLKELIAYDPEIGNYDRIAALRMLLIYMADLEKFGVVDLDDHDSNNNKKTMDPFFLRTRSSLNSKFTSSSNEYNFKRPIRQRTR